MTYPRHLPNCVIPAKAGTQADGSVVEDDIGKARVSVDGIDGTTNVVFTDASAPAQLVCTPWKASRWWLTRCGSDWRQPMHCGMGKWTMHDRVRDTQSERHNMKTANILNWAIHRVLYIAIAVAVGLMLALASGGCNSGSSENTFDVFLDRIDQAIAANANGEYDRAIGASNEAISLWPENPLSYMARGTA